MANELKPAVAEVLAKFQQLDDYSPRAVAALGNGLLGLAARAGVHTAAREKVEQVLDTVADAAPAVIGSIFDAVAKKFGG